MIPVDSSKLQDHIDTERKKHSLWAFLAEHGSGKSGYSSGYLAALEELEGKVRRGELDLMS